MTILMVRLNFNLLVLFFLESSYRFNAQIKQNERIVDR